MYTIRIDEKVLKIKDSDYVELRKLEKDLINADSSNKEEFKNKLVKELEYITNTQRVRESLDYQFDTTNIYYSV